MESTIVEQQARLIAGDVLSTAEQESLVLGIEQHPDERDAFLHNQSMESQLRLLARLDQSEEVEGFVSATVSRARSNWGRQERSH